MESVAFITTELSDDLIISFAVQLPDDPGEIESLTLVRTPKYEGFLEEHERGVNVSFERFGDEQEDYLEEATYIVADAVVQLKTTSHNYELSVHKVDQSELKRMCLVLRKMNFDEHFLSSGF